MQELSVVEVAQVAGGGGLIIVYRDIKPQN